MQKQHKHILAKLSLEKADEALTTGYKNLEINLNTVQNRAYYAVFYTVLALGYMDGFVTGKHHRLAGWFNKKYVYQDKVFPPSLSKTYTGLMINRETFDYDVTEKPTKEEAIKDLEKAKSFIDELKPYICEKIKNKE